MNYGSKLIKSSVLLVFFGIGIGILGCSSEKESLEITSSTIVNEQTIRNNKSFAEQFKIKQSLEQELEKDYFLEKPFVVVDPYHISPLTAVAIFKTQEPTRITVEVQGKDKYSTIRHSFKTFSKKHMVPIYGCMPIRLIM